jgi:hypothetical protein
VNTRPAAPSAGDTSPFRLRKWYLDCVAADGTAFIGYSALLSWRGFSLEYAATLFAPAGGAVREQHAVRGAAAPRLEAGGCGWSCAPLGVQAHWSTRAPVIRRTLLRTAEGGIRWTCHQPRAHARVRLDGGDGGGSSEITGSGYVEEIELTVPPWRLPFRRLWWGRFVGSDTSLIWIGWHGSTRRRLALLDGDRHAITRLGRTGISAGSADLSIEEGRALRHGSIVGNVLSAAPALVSVLPASFLGATEHKRVGRGTLRRPGRPDATGWTIHELVQW